jgi:hypothetical protein
MIQAFSHIFNIFNIASPCGDMNQSTFPSNHVKKIISNQILIFSFKCSFN